ncbi:MAG TPA: hypothetical protein VG388_15255 [Solirubrobacteraceae bacterium]|jgi:hypothetical protein|nr:hypothetical protein [Solirubrobacteraceae bacterium]
MTTIALDADQLRQLDDETRQAWTAYSDRLRDLTAEEYELIESESWDQLQLELRRLDQRRRALERSARR